MKRSLALISLLLLVAPTAIQAAGEQPTPQLQAFLKRKEQQELALGWMIKQWQSSVPTCSSPRLKQMSLIVFHAPSFDEGGAPVSGNWKMVGQVEGCGEARVFNLMYGFTQNGRLSLASLLPGTTIADPILQRDALPYAVMGMVAIKPNGCKDLKLLDTKFLAFSANPTAAGGRNQRAWSEEWTLQTCEVRGLVKLHFTPDATGTSISAQPNETKVLR